MMRKVEEKDLVGKTIESYENSSVNVLTLKFTDGTKLELWTETAISSPFGDIAGIFVEE